MKWVCAYVCEVLVREISHIVIELSSMLKGWDGFESHGRKTQQWTYHVARLNELWDFETDSEPLVWGFTFFNRKTFPIGWAVFVLG